MSNLRMTHAYEAPLEQVFAAFTNFEHAADFITGIERIEMLTDGPVGKGTRFRETRIMFKKATTEAMEVTDYEPGRAYTLSCNSCGCAWDSTFRFRPDGDRTVVDMEMTTKPLTLMAKLMAPVCKLMMGGAMKKCMEKDFTDIEHALQGRAAMA